MPDGPSRLIAARLRAPQPPPGTVVRPRVLDELREAAAERRILMVVASAGAGKTTAVAQFVADRPGPSAWLTLDDSHDGPGRFVTYLAAALEALQPGLRGRLDDLLGDGLSAADCAGVLADALSGATLVIDDVHSIDAHAPVLRTLRAFLAALPPDGLVVLVSRRLVQADLNRHALAGRLGALSDEELAFDLDEIAALLSAHRRDADPAAIARATGGWAAGVAFDLQRGSRAHRVLGAGEDPFFAYLGEEVISTLDPALAAVVLRSAVLDVVNPDTLRAVLAVAEPEAIFDDLCAQHLPGTRDGDGLRHHPRFREFLQARLRRDHPAELAELNARLATHQLAAGQVEEAIDNLLAGDRADEAAAAMHGATGAVMRRGDWDKVLRWCAAVGERRLSERPALRGAQIRSLLMGRHQDEVMALVAALRASGEYDRLVREAPETAIWAVWALHGSGEWREHRALMPRASGSRRAAVIDHILAVGTGDGPPPPLEPGALDRVQPLHVALQSACYYRGQFAAVERLAAAAAARGPVTATLAQIYRIAALRARGRLSEARAALTATARQVRESRFIEFWQATEAELLFAEGRREEGLDLLRTARQTSRAHLYRVADRAVFAAIEGKMLVRMGAAAEAAELLAATGRWCNERGLAAFREWSDTWLAAALLLLREDPHRPRALLVAATAGMLGASRHLEAPAAHILLAEAHWRAGDETAHDAAVDVAHALAVAGGSLTPLVETLALVPEVLPRRRDAAAADDERWSALARAIGDQPQHRGNPAARLRIRTLGAPALELDGRPLPRIHTKTVELAGALARGGEGGVARERLIEELFDGSGDASNYLRQTVYRLRRALPSDIGVVLSDGRLSLLPADAAIGDDQELDGLLSDAQRAAGPDRLAALAAVAALAARGPYLPGSDGEAVARRRDRLGAAVDEALQEYAQLLLGAGRTPEALALTESLVERAPYDERRWRLHMRASAAAGGPAGAAPVFAACRAALAELGVEPAPETVALLQRLRGAR